MKKAINRSAIMKSAHTAWKHTRHNRWMYPGKTFADCLREAWAAAKKEAVVQARIITRTIAKHIAVGDTIEYGGYCISIRKIGTVASTKDIYGFDGHEGVHVNFTNGTAHCFVWSDPVNKMKEAA